MLHSYSTAIVPDCIVRRRNTRSVEKGEAILQNWPRMAELATRALKSQIRSGARSLAAKKVQAASRIPVGVTGIAPNDSLLMVLV